MQATYQTAKARFGCSSYQIEEVIDEVSMSMLAGLDFKPD